MFTLLAEDITIGGLPITTLYNMGGWAVAGLILFFALRDQNRRAETTNNFRIEELKQTNTDSKTVINSNTTAMNNVSLVVKEHSAAIKELTEVVRNRQ